VQVRMLESAVVTVLLFVVPGDVVDDILNLICKVTIACSDSAEASP
jgi:hypothetical protein